jgi:hypothetical protein
LNDAAAEAMSYTRIFKGATRCVALMIVTAASTERTSALRDLAATQDSPLGDWRGMSVCQVKPSGCRDEDSLYHIRTVGTKGGELQLRAEKIVDGKPVTLGTSPCAQSAPGQLECRISESATLSFDVRGNVMEGVFKIGDGTVWRKLTLRRVPQ